MGQMIDEEECEICIPFEQEWIFTYGDLVTLLLCFFILLFSMCKTDVEKSKRISDSFKSMPPGSPFIFSGQSSALDKASRELEQLEVPDDVSISASKAGVEVSFSKTVAFAQGSVILTEKAKGALNKMLPIIGQLQNYIEISGHTDESDANQKYPSNWELSTARANSVLKLLLDLGFPPNRLSAAGYGEFYPIAEGDSADILQQNRRIELKLTSR